MRYKYKYREVQFDNIQDAVLYKLYNFHSIRQLELFINDTKYNKIKNIVSTYYNDDLYLKNDWIKGCFSNFDIKYGFLKHKSINLRIGTLLEILKSTPEHIEECNYIIEKSKELYCGNKFADKLVKSYRKAKNYAVVVKSSIHNLQSYVYTINIECDDKYGFLIENDGNKDYYSLYYNEKDKCSPEFIIKVPIPTLDIETYIVTPPEVTIEPVGIKYSSEDIYELVNKLFDKIDKDYEDKQNQIACHKDNELDLVRRFEEC